MRLSWSCFGRGIEKIEGYVAFMFGIWEMGISELDNIIQKMHGEGCKIPKASKPCLGFGRQRIKVDNRKANVWELGAGDK